MDYKKKYLKYKLKYLTTKKMLGGDEGQEAKSYYNRALEYLDQKSGTPCKQKEQFICDYYYNCDENWKKALETATECEKKIKNSKTKRKTLDDGLAAFSESKILEGENPPFKWDTETLGEFWKQTSPYAVPPEPKKKDAEDKKKGHIKILEEHAKYMAEHYYRYESLYLKDLYTDYIKTIEDSFEPITLSDKLKKRKTKLSPDDFVLEILRLTFRKWVESIDDNDNTKKIFGNKIEMARAFQSTQYQFWTDKILNDIESSDRASVYAKAFYKELLSLMPEIEPKEDLLAQYLRGSTIVFQII